MTTILGGESLKNLLKKLLNRETMLYLLFGVLTTVVNIGVCGLLGDYLNWNIYAANTIAWILAVLFAFITNKLFVFNSRSTNRRVLLKESVLFLVARLISLGADMLIIWLLATLCGLNLWVVKIISNLVVIILNYIFSKGFIFHHKPQTTKTEGDKTC